MAATDAGLFYLDYDHSTSSLFNDYDGSSSVGASWVAAHVLSQDMGKAGTVPTLASRCLVNGGVQIVKN